MRIRNQNEDAIINLDRFDIITVMPAYFYKNNDEHTIIVSKTEDANHNIILGTYNTKDFALAVLDAIFMALNVDVLVFQMPPKDGD
jgi:hypothetical protein